MKLSVIIPCLNERKTIKTVIIHALKSLLISNINEFEIIIADNGSTDGSLSIINKLSKLKVIKLVQVKTKGYGAALHTGILKAKYSYILYADADLSYSFNQIPLFQKKLSGNYDLVLGSRFSGNIHSGAMPFLHRYVGTPVLTFLIRIIYGIKTTDCNSGMRMVKKSFYKKLNMKNSGMEWASELLVKSAINNAKYTEVPIDLFPDQRGRKPHLNSWNDGWRHLKVIILLKPVILLYISIGSMVLGLIASSVKNSIHPLIIFCLFSQFIFFSYLSLRQLEAAISKNPNKVSTKLDSLPLVGIGILLLITSFSLMLFVDGSLILISYLLVFESIFYGIWIFFIETIRTHMINLLPEEINNDIS